MQQCAGAIPGDLHADAQQDERGEANDDAHTGFAHHATNGFGIEGRLVNARAPRLNKLPISRNNAFAKAVTQATRDRHDRRDTKEYRDAEAADCREAMSRDGSGATSAASGLQ